jgi:DNA transformation protein
MLGSETPLRGLKNIGPTIAARLEAVGIRTVGELRRVGSAAAYHLIKANSPGQTIPVCYYLYSLQGALDGIHWNDLPEKKKRRLLDQVR